MSKVILTVDDSASVRHLLEASLSGVGYEVVVAGDGLEGLAMLEQVNVDLIISDVNMPNMDGLSFIKEVRKNDKTKFTPIMMLTTERSREQLEEAK